MKQVIVDLDEYLELVKIKEVHEDNIIKLRGCVSMPQTDYEQLKFENRRLKEQINTTNISINNWINSSKAEMQEYGYNHEKYWGMFKELREGIKKELNGKENSNYAVIDREREEELLDKEDRINKAIKYIEDFNEATMDEMPDKLIWILEGKVHE